MFQFVSVRVSVETTSPAFRYFATDTEWRQLIEVESSDQTRVPFTDTEMRLLVFVPGAYVAVGAYTLADPTGTVLDVMR